MGLRCVLNALLPTAHPHTDILPLLGVKTGGIHALDDEGKIRKPVHVPDMFADVIVALATQTTADDKTAQFLDATAWASKQMRLNYKQMQEFIKAYNLEPEWVAKIKTKRAKEASDLADLDDEAKAAAFRRIGMRGSGKPAPGEPLGGLANAKPIDPAKAKKFDPKKRGLEKLPLKHVDDPANFVDGKTNWTRQVGTWARFQTGSAGRTKTQLHRWCVCDESKASGDGAI